MSLHDKQILITGATGFIGGRLAQRLARDEGAVVIGTGRSPDKAAFLKAEGVELRTADITDTAVMQELMTGQDVVFHAAAWMGRPARDLEAARQVNVMATAELVRLAAAAGVGRFVHVSTIAVYGPPTQETITEDQPLNLAQTSIYGRTKAEGELEAARLAAEFDLPFTIIRPAMVYGPRSRGWSSGMLELVRKGTPVVIGGGHGYAQPVFIDNLVDGLLLAAVRPEAVGEAFHFSDAPLPWRDFFAYYGAMCGRKPRGLPLFLVRALAAANEWIGFGLPIDREAIAFYTAQSIYPTNKAEQLLGYRSRINLDEGMRQTEAWLREAGYLPANA